MTTTKQDRTIAVTGASRGIGAAIARELARREYAVACLNRNGRPTPVDEAFPKDARQRLTGISCDVRESGSVNAAIKAANDIGGGLFGVVNNAGITKGGPSRSFSREDFQDVLTTNVLGVFTVCQAAYPYLAARGEGMIVNIGSFWDQIGGKGYTAYCASKAAVGAISRCLAVEWAKKGIRVLNIAPGYVETDMTSETFKREEVKAHLANRIPGGSVGKPDDIAKLVAALCCEDIHYLTGSTIYIDGAQRIAP